MGLTPYPHQLEQSKSVSDAWGGGERNVLAVAPTGSGKTVIAAHKVSEHNGYSCTIAHRSELVSQLSIAYAQEEIPHNIIGPTSLIKNCVTLQMQKVGKSFFRPNADCTVASVDTLVRRMGAMGNWGKQQSLWVQDEAHHVQQANKWGRVLNLFPNAKGLGFTATTRRNDGHGLGAWNDGVFHAMVLGKDLRWHIDNGWLTDYAIYVIPNNLDLSKVKTGSDGDFVRAQAAAAVRKSTIMGDVVKHYIEHTYGKLGITFATDVSESQEIADKFNVAGVPAACIHAGTPAIERYKLLRKFENREILQLVNCDIFGEGFDLPAIEVCSFARPTASWALYVQQFGRALRKLEGKKVAYIFDHVGNVFRHFGPPDRPITHSLERAEKRVSSAQILMYKVCANPTCNRVYERFLKDCPFCGYAPKPVERSTPDYVEGDLEELSPAALRFLRGEIDKIDQSVESYRTQLFVKRCPPAGIIRHTRFHSERQAAQGHLRECIAVWAGVQRSKGRKDSESHKLFWLLFGVDVLTAQTYGPKEANDLTVAISKQLTGDSN